MNGNINLKNFKQVALDTNIFIYHFHEYPKLTDLADVIFVNLADNKLKAVTSLITLIELLSFKTPEPAINELKNAFYSTPNLSVLTIEQDIAMEAARIRRVYGFRLPDSIQLATALIGKAQAFVTNDQQLKKFHQLPIVLLNSQ
ncbi:MAG: PIN domain-containing protein [Candidatus Curtissbacteria bacterium]